jgi:excisionase family DNA binding protein
MPGELRPITQKPLISVAEAAPRLGISESSGYRLAYAGELPGLVRLLGTRMRVRARVLDAWLNGQELASERPANNDTPWPPRTR